MEKLSWRKQTVGPVTLHSIKRNVCPHQVLINEYSDRTEIELSIAAKSFASLNLTIDGQVKIEANLYAGRMRIIETMPKDRCMRETKRRAKLWHNQVKDYKL